MFTQGIRYSEYRNKVPKSIKNLGCTPFDLTIPTQVGFDKAPKKCLIVIDHVSTEDLYANRLLSSEVARITMSNVMKQAKLWAAKFGDVVDYKFAVINFNFCKTYHLHGNARDTVDGVATKRVQRYIEEIKPDMIMVFGDTAVSCLIPKVKNPLMKHGWLHNYRNPDKGHKCKLVSTLQFDIIAPEEKIDREERTQVDYSNLIGFSFRCLSSAFLNKMPVSLSHIIPGPRLINTKVAFKKMMRRVRAAKGVAVDTETTGLGVLNNTLLTIQFAVDTKRGYVVPIGHRDSKFSQKDAKYIRRDLHAYFSEKVEYEGNDTRYLIMQNGAFDLRIIRRCLNVPFIYWPIWDTQAGQYCLDENVTAMRHMKIPLANYGLAAMFCHYGNDFYYTASFGKADRTTIADVPLKGGCLDYCAMDPQATFGLHLAQLKMASGLRLADKNFQPTYRRFVLTQMSNMVHMISTMVNRGTEIDIPYLMYVKSNDSPVFKLINDAIQELYNMDSAKKANRLLLRKREVPQSGMFGRVNKEPWIFDISKQAHKAMLFVKVLGLKAEEGAVEGTYSFDKYFQKANSASPEVGILGRMNKLNVLYNTFCKGIYERVVVNEDGKIDRRLRPGYGYLDVVTGRSNSYAPSLQQIPQHSAEAKLIKREFITSGGRIKIKVDMSAHEVRCWGIGSGDTVLAESMNNINKFIKLLRKKQTPKLLGLMKQRGDAHISNYNLFTGVPVDKITPKQRQDSKAISFGAIYGKAVQTMAKDLEKTLEEMQKVYDKFFGKFSRAKKWLDWTGDFAEKHGYTFSILGRRRNLFAVFSGHPRLFNAIRRRAQNSPVQGIGSDIVFTAARLIEKAIYETFVKLEKVEKYCAQTTAGTCVMVHDSDELEMLYEDFFIVMWITEYMTTIGLKKYLIDTFDIKINTDFAIEMEVGTSGDTFKKWDWTDGSLRKIIRNALTVQRDVLKQDVDVEAVEKLIYKEGAKHHKYLQKNFPLPYHPLTNYVNGEEKPFVENPHDKEKRLEAEKAAKKAAKKAKKSKLKKAA